MLSATSSYSSYFALNDDAAGHSNHGYLSNPLKKTGFPSAVISREVYVRSRSLNLTAASESLFVF